MCILSLPYFCCRLYGHQHFFRNILGIYAAMSTRQTGSQRIAYIGWKQSPQFGWIFKRVFSFHIYHEYNSKCTLSFNWQIVAFTLGRALASVLVSSLWCPENNWEIKDLSVDCGWSVNIEWGNPRLYAFTPHCEKQIRAFTTHHFKNTCNSKQY